jgi:hypothetical protein
MDSYLGLQFCCIGRHIWFCASTMLFFCFVLFCLLWLYSIVWSPVLWHLQCYSFCSVFPWLFTSFYASKWTLGLIFQSLWWISLEF